MGGFVLQRTQREIGSEADCAVPCSILERKGLPRGVTITRDGFTLHLFLKSIAPTKNIVEAANGDFVAATGTLAYRGTFGTKGLERLLEDAVLRQVDWTELARSGWWAVNHSPL